MAPERMYTLCTQFVYTKLEMTEMRGGKAAKLTQFRGFEPATNGL